MVITQASRLLKEPAARAYLGMMSHGQFFRLRQEGRIRAVYVGRSVFFDRADLDAFVESLADAHVETAPQSHV